MTTSELHPTPSTFLAACRAQPVEHTPVWFMRQAGRSLPEYREARVGIAMLDACNTPDLVTKLTLQPVRRYGVDAAVFYSDIMVPLKAAGIDLDIVPGTGPVIADPIRDRSDIDRLPGLDIEDLGPITAAVAMTVAELGSTPLLGFAGAPFTLASYLIEGGPSKDYSKTKALMVGDPDSWHALCTKLAAISTTFLEAQIQAGARGVQLFDSWVGSLSVEDYRTFVKPHSVDILSRIGELGVPRIHFGVGATELLVDLAEAGADVMGVDWRIPLAEANRRLGGRYPLQGNLDPALLAAPWPVIEERVRRICASGSEAPGHIFNLGHGVPPSADPEVLGRIVALVQSLPVPDRGSASGPPSA